MRLCKKKVSPVASPYNADYTILGAPLLIETTEFQIGNFSKASPPKQPGTYELSVAWQKLWCCG